MEFIKSKLQRGVFIIMPFVETITRDQVQLTSYFENNIKRPVEEASLKYQYKVWRSGTTFNITDEIIKDLFRADIVIADLSGEHPNPNVMYELGVRLSVSEKPVILIREKNAKNKKVFDVDGYYTHQYDPLNYTELEKHLVETLERFETGEETFISPVKKVLYDELILSQSKLSNLTPSQQKEIVLRGVELIRSNISNSFGPLGKGIPIKDKHDSYTLAKGGYEIAKATWSSNPLENRGIEFLSEIGRIMLEKHGDGTKTAMLLACQMMESGNEGLKKGYLAKHIIRGMEKAVNEAVSYIEGVSTLLRDKSEVAAVGVTASKNKEIGNIITDCMDKTGKEGIIQITKSDSAKTTVEITEGFNFNRGFISSEFVSNQENTSWIADKCLILLYPFVISSHSEILPLLEKVAKEGLPILILAADIQGAALETLLLNSQKGVIKCAAIRFPLNEDSYRNIFEDIAIVTGGTIVSSTRGTSLSRVAIKDLGVAGKVIVTKVFTRIQDGEGRAEEIRDRIKRIKTALESTSDMFDMRQYQDRLAMICGGTAIIYVGGETPQEADEDFYGFRSAMFSTRAAVENGAVTGGAVPLYLAKEQLLRLSAENEGEKSGIEAIVKSLEVPIVCLIESFGLIPEQVIENIQSHESTSWGFNAEKGIVEDLLKAEILDPSKTIIKALKIALSHSKMFLETTIWADQKSSDIEV